MTVALGIAIVAGLGVAFWALSRRLDAPSPPRPAAFERAPYRSAPDDPTGPAGWEHAELLALDDPRWATLEDGRDAGAKVPALLRAIAADPDGADDAYAELMRRCARGTSVTKTALAATPHLVAMSERTPKGARLVTFTLAVAGLTRALPHDYGRVAKDLRTWWELACDRARHWPAVLSRPGHRWAKRSRASRSSTTERRPSPTWPEGAAGSCRSGARAAESSRRSRSAEIARAG